MNRSKYSLLISLMTLVALLLIGCGGVAGQAATVPPTVSVQAPTSEALVTPDQWPQANVLFTAPNPVIALAADKNENVYAVIYKTGDIIKIAPDGESTTIYSGLQSCGFSAYAALTMLPDGAVVASDCTDKKKPMLIKIDPSGHKTILATFDEADGLMSLTSDPSGQIYAGLWTSNNTNVTLNANPSYLSAAEDLTGYVAELGADGNLNRLHEGGIPMAMAAPEKGTLFAATWGKGGPFVSESREYGVCVATTMLWLVLSDRVEISQIKPGQELSEPLKLLDAVSAIAAGRNGLLFAAGKGKGETDPCGIYYIQPGRDPKKLSFPQRGVDKSITALAVTDNNLYWGDIDGHVSKVSLATALQNAESILDASSSQEAGTSAAVAEVSREPNTPETPTKWAQPLPSPDPTLTPTITPTPTPSLPAASWSPITDMPRKINTLAIDPANPQILYAGTGQNGSGSGVYKSEDGGLTWQLASNGLPNDDVMALAISRSDPPALLAIVGVRGYTYASTDGAQSWKRVSSTEQFGGFERRLYTSPADDNVLFNLTRGSGLRRSRDGGHTWPPIGQGLPGDGRETFVLSLAFDPADAKVIYAGTGGFGGQGHGVYRSTDGGETWSPINRGMIDYRITTIAVDPQQPHTLYAGSDDGELFKSEDGGQTWDKLSANLPLRQDMHSSIHDIVLDPGQPGMIYLLCDRAGILTSADGGVHWSILGAPGETESSMFTALAIRPGPQPLIIAGLEQTGGWRYGVSQSTPTPTTSVPSASGTHSAPLNLTGSWEELTDLPRFVNALIGDVANPQIVYAGTGQNGSGSGVYKSEDSGSTWQSVSKGLPNDDVTALAISHGNPAVLHALTGVSGDSYSSPDGAKSWKRAGSTALFGGFERKLVVAPTDDKVLFSVAYPGGLARSRDGGRTWSAVNKGLPQNDWGVGAASMAFDPTDAKVIYLGTQGNGVYKSIDGGETWAASNRSMLDYTIDALAIDPAQPQTIYAGANSGEFFKSTDGGQTWQNLTDQLHLQNTHSGIGGIIVDPATPNRIYLLSQSAGVLFSGDGGLSWQVLGKPAQADNPKMTMTVFFNPDPIFIVGTQGAGAWRYAAHF